MKRNAEVSYKYNCYVYSSNHYFWLYWIKETTPLLSDIQSPDNASQKADSGISRQTSFSEQYTRKQ